MENVSLQGIWICKQQR